MKAFITSPSDTFRAPYDKKADAYPRLTSFGATTNSDQFLKEENSRRYWTIEAEDIDLDTLTGINFDAVWAEAMALYRLLGSLSFRLTAAERSALARENRSFQIVRDEEALLRACWTGASRGTSGGSLRHRPYVICWEWVEGCPR